jgi:hypothetical protein
MDRVVPYGRGFAWAFAGLIVIALLLVGAGSLASDNLWLAAAAFVTSIALSAWLVCEWRVDEHGWYT